LILAIDPGNIESAYVILDRDLKPIEFGKVENNKLLPVIDNAEIIGVKSMATEMVASYGMPVGAEVFETVLWIGRFWERAVKKGYEVVKIYRKDVKMNLCHSMNAKDGNIIQALIDRFAYGVSNRGKGTKKNPGWFYGFKNDIWQAYAIGVTYYDLYVAKEN
jgi:hypothetical protein